MNIFCRNPKKLLFLLAEFPWPPVTGIQYNTSVLIDYLVSQGYEIEIIGWSTRDEWSLPSHLRQAVKILHVKRRKGRMPRALAWSLSRKLFAWGTGGWDSISMTLPAWSGEGVVHAESMLAIPYLDRMSGPTIISLLDPPSLRFKRLFLKCYDLKRVVESLGQWWFGAHLERRFVASGSPIHLVSSSDACYLSRRHRDAKVVQIPIAYSLGDLQGASRGVNQGDPIAVLGDFRLPQHRRPLVHFLERLWPAIIRAHPQLELLVIGAIADGDRLLDTIRQAPGLTWKPFVVDYLRAVDTASIVLCLDDTGTGLKNRVIQAMALGKIVIGSRHAMEGVPAVHRRHAFVYGELDELADLIPEVAGGIQRYRAIGIRGADLARSLYSIERVGKRWEELYAQLGAGRFTGGEPPGASGTVRRRSAGRLRTWIRYRQPSLPSSPPSAGPDSKGRPECLHPKGAHVTIPDQDLDLASSRMKRDWDARARSNAKWYINTVSRKQTEAEFDRTGRFETEALVLSQLPLLTGGREPSGLRMLEIGCGIGRMSLPLAEIFGEVHATDVSGEMVARARKRVGDRPNVFLRETNGVDFRDYPDGFFDVILCAYVYQHVPSLAVILGNAAEAYRVLRPGGVFKFQANGVTNPEYGRLAKDTWAGETFPAARVRDLARELGAQMIGSFGIGRQHCWHLWRRPAGVAAASGPVRIEHIRIPANGPGPGPMGSLLVSGLDPDRSDVNTVAVELEGRRKELCYVGPAGGAGWTDLGRPEGEPSWMQLDFLLDGNEPEGVASLTLIPPDGAPALSAECCLPLPAPLAPVIVLVTNGADGGTDIQRYGPKREVRLFVDHLAQWQGLEGLEILLGGRCVPHRAVAFVPVSGLHMITFRLPSWAESGEYAVSLQLGSTCSGAVPLAVGARGWGGAALEVLRSTWRRLR